jgi:hypothetical protein
MSALLESRREEHKLLNDKLKKLIDSMQELRSAGSPSSSMLEVVAAWVAASQDRLETPRLQPAERLPTPNDERDEIVANARSTWYVQVRFENTDISAAAIGKTIWALSSAIESVPGVVVKIESWESGSLVARLRVFIRNVWARDEVREVLHKGRNAAVAHYLDRPTEEAQKLRAEREKLEEEKRLLQQKADSYSTDAEKRITELNIAVKEEELRSQQLDNSLKAIELVERASSLVRDGLISADKLSIDINGLAYFLFDGRNVDTGEPMARIEQKEDVIADNDVPPAEQSDE